MLLIREADKRDLPEIMHLLQGMDADEQQLRLDDYARIWDEINKYPYYKIFVAEDDFNIIGTCSLIIIDNLGHRGAKLAVAENMIINPAYRGQGAGTQIMRFIMDQARAMKCYKLMLSSNKKRIRAHNFYEQLGFEQHGISYMIRLEP